MHMWRGGPRPRALPVRTVVFAEHSRASLDRTAGAGRPHVSSGSSTQNQDGAAVVDFTAMSFTDQLGFSFKPLDRRIWTVRDLVAAVRTHIEREYGDTWVEGEISNFRAHDSGHLYFTLKDQNAQIRAVMFRS